MATVNTAVIVSVNGSPLVLLPGDEIPEGVRVSAPGVVSESAPSTVEPAEPRGNASRKEWAAYAAALDVDVTDLTRNEIKEAVNELRNS